MRIKRLVAPFLLLLSGMLGAENAVNMFELPNGLKILFCPVTNVEATAVCLYYTNGSRNDPPDMRGVSYFFQDLMFQGTANLEPLDHVLFVTQKGGIISGKVSYDNNLFYQVVPFTDLPIALRYESERLRSLRLDNGIIEMEKRQILGRISRMESSVNSRARQWVLQTLLAGTPYENPVYGDPDKLRQFMPERVRDFYKNYQNPSNFLLVVCGKLDINDLKNKVNDFFQDIPGGLRSSSSFTSVPLKERAGVYKNWAVEGLSRPLVIYGFPVPGRLSMDYFYFDFIRSYFAGEKISQLEYVLNQVNRLDVGIHVILTDYFENNALLIEMSAANRENLEKAKFLLSREMLNLQTLPISNNERAKVKNYMEINCLKQIRSPEVMAQKIAEYYHMLQRLDFLSAYLNHIRKIDSYDIMNMAKKYLKRDYQVVLNVYGKK